MIQNYLNIYNFEISLKFAKTNYLQLLFAYLDVEHIIFF